MKMAYSTYSGTRVEFLNRLYQSVDRTTHQDPHPGLIIAEHHFHDPYPLVNDIDLLCLATMDLLTQLAYLLKSGILVWSPYFMLERMERVE